MVAGREEGKIDVIFHYRSVTSLAADPTRDKSDSEAATGGNRALMVN